MGPGDSTGFQLEIAVLKIGPRFLGDSSLQPMTFLQSLDLLKDKRAVFRRLSVNRAVATYEYGEENTAGFSRYKAYQFAALRSDDTLFIVTATASQRTAVRGGPFHRENIANADSVVLGLIVRR